MSGKLLGLSAVLALGVTATAAYAQSRPLTVVSWGGAYQAAQREVYFEPFKKATGIKMIDESWDGGIGVLRAKVQGGNVPWDVVQVESEELELGCDEGLYHELDYGKIGGKDAYLKAAVHACGVGAIVYNFVLGYDKDKLKTAPTSWADFFDVKKFPGTRAMWNNPYHNIEIALLADGVPADKLYPLDLDRAFKKLRELKPFITVWYTSGGQATQLLTDGEIDMMPFWNGRVAKVMESGAPVDMTFNQGILAFDCVVIPRGAKNKELAMKVLNRLLQPDLQAAISKLIPYGPVNSAAFTSGLISPELAAGLPSAPENLKLQVPVDDAWWGDLKNAEKVQEMWTQLVQE